MFVKLCLTHGSLGPRRPISGPRGSKYSPKVWDCNASHAKIPGECCDSNQSLHRFGEYLRVEIYKPSSAKELQRVFLAGTSTRRTSGIAGIEPSEAITPCRVRGWSVGESGHAGPMASLCGQSRDMGPPFARSGRSLTVDMPIGSIGTQLGAYHQRNCPAATQKSRSLPNVSPPKTHQRVAPAATDTPDRAPIAARGAGPKIRWRPSVALAQQPACEPGPPINHSGAESARSRSLCDFLASR
jgi:hypothetical protein